MVCVRGDFVPLTLKSVYIIAIRQQNVEQSKKRTPGRELPGWS